MSELGTYKETYFDKAMIKEFNLQEYIYSVTGEKREEVINITRDELTRFQMLCDTIFLYFHSEWDREGLETSTLNRQKNAILGKEIEVKYFKDNIEDYLKKNNKLGEWYPNWYIDLIDAIYQECWGLGGIAEWKNSKEYELSQSAKIIGNRIYFMENGKMKLQQQTISDERRRQLIKALLLNEKNIHYDGRHAEVSMHDGTRITIYGEKIVKENLEVIIFRKYIIPKLTFEEQAKRKTIPYEAITMFKNMVDIGYNVLFTGAVRTGKTTFLETWQMYENTSLEGLMIETGAEIPSHKLQPFAPIIQLVADDDELGNIIKPILRSDADYIIAAEARDGRALNVSMRAANKGTRRCKTTYHTTEPIDICYDIADEIVKFYGGDLYNTIFKVSKSFHYVFHFIQLANKDKKRLKGIYEIRFDRQLHTITIHQICQYDYDKDSWKFKYDIGQDKEDIGHEEDNRALIKFKKELKKLEQLFPYDDYSIYEPTYERVKGVNQ
ncbi:MAG: ATPase, T2SS/T4P/T4SS family [Vallitalea sp.]|jgi:pilus assembly protein CpaF|nr:ATPase, T2SS/T4P/T4SS family [Vallitalea sp.]